MGDRIQSRMDQVLGESPRLKPLPEDQLDTRARELINGMRKLREHDFNAPAHPFYCTLGHSPALFSGYMELGVRITADSAIPVRERELIILCCGWLCGAPYEWGEHVSVGRQAGLSSEEIERITEGSSASAWGEMDRALLKAVEELHNDAMISDQTWELLARHFSERQLVELPIIVGHYHMTAFLQNSLRFALNDYNEGLAAR